LTHGGHLVTANVKH